MRLRGAHRRRVQQRTTDSAAAAPVSRPLPSIAGGIWAKSASSSPWPASGLSWKISARGRSPGVLLPAAAASPSTASRTSRRPRLPPTANGTSLRRLRAAWVRPVKISRSAECSNEEGAAAMVHTADL